MSIFANKKNGNTATGDAQTFGYIQPTAESLDQILTESAKDSYQIRGGLYISDILMEEAVLEGAATEEVLLEGFVKGLWAKVKEMFEKLAAKLKDWFNKVKRALQIWFTSGKEFVDKFEKELKAKSAKGYSYKTFKFTMAAGFSKYDGLFKKVEDTINPYLNGIQNVDQQKSSSAHKDAIDANKGSYKESYNTSEEKEALLKALGGESIEDVQKELAKAFRNGADEKSEFEDFNGNSKDDMIKAIKEKDKSLKEVEKSEKEFESTMSRIIKAIETGGSKVKGDDAGNVSTYVSHSTEIIRYCVAVASSLSRINVDAIKEAAREFEAILKGYLRFKPAKEGFEGEEDENTDSDSILESAMKYL